ncbi:capsular polysaccharide biosynthesis protein CapF [Hungatella hathewayi]
MKILVTGANGFIGKNLIIELRNRGFLDVCEYDTNSGEELLESYCQDCDFVFNLAGVNRPLDPIEFQNGNFGFASHLLELLEKYQNACPVMLASSVQAELNNPYGRSKKASEDLFFLYGQKNNSAVYIYRFPNVFGKWCRPNYNSVVATFCYNISRSLPISVNDASTILNLVYIDDVTEELIGAMEGLPSMREDGFCEVPITHMASLGEIVELLYSFKNSRDTKIIPDMTDGGFVKKLYSTYLSYLPTDSFNYPLKMNVDERGSFNELFRTPDRGQVSVNISKPGITKGNHWHHTKNEKFVVVSGKGLIRFRKVGTGEILDYHVSGDKIEVVDIPVGYTHSIVNEGETDLVTLMWCNECFQPEKPDTYYLNVEETDHE